MQNERPTLIKQTASLILQNIHKHLYAYTLYKHIMACAYIVSHVLFEKNKRKRGNTLWHRCYKDTQICYVFWTPKENAAQLKVSTHWVRNFHMLKNKYDLTLWRSCLHVASETFVRQNFFGSVSIFCVFASVAFILIGKDEEYEKTAKRMRKFQTQSAMAFRLNTQLDEGLAHAAALVDCRC